MTTTIKKTKRPPRLTWREYALLTYIERAVEGSQNTDGIFHETAEQISQTIKADPRCIQTALRDLYDSGLLEEVHALC